MGWKDLLSEEEQTIVAPWMGGRSLHSGGRTRTIAGDLPVEHGWYEFTLSPRRARVGSSCHASPNSLGWLQEGYLVGDRFVPDDVRPAQLQHAVARRFPRVHLAPPGLERFSRVQVGALRPRERLVFRGLAFPLGPESDVLTAYLDRTSVRDVAYVIPSLEAAFKLECRVRDRAERRREELARAARAARERREREARLRELRDSLESGVGRRALANIDMHSAAEAALAVGGATLLDIRPGHAGDTIVRYRLDGRRFECSCDEELRIIDSGVCLTDETTGERGDRYFTLESLPSVIRQAEREGVLVVYRHG